MGIGIMCIVLGVLNGSDGTFSTVLGIFLLAISLIIMLIWYVMFPSDRKLKRRTDVTPFTSR